MRYEVPMQTVYGENSNHPLVLEQAGDEIRLTIDGGFAGRDVDEELPKSAFLALLSGGAQRNNDLLGLTLQTDGGPTVTGLVGVGSGNIGFVVNRDELATAIDGLK
jgi:hypothetical protein